jgi:hypothetical protein
LNRCFTPFPDEIRDPTPVRRAHDASEQYSLEPVVLRDIYFDCIVVLTKAKEDRDRWMDIAFLQ